MGPVDPFAMVVNNLTEYDRHIAVEQRAHTGAVLEKGMHTGMLVMLG